MNNDNLEIPHILDLVAGVTDAARELHGMSLTISGLLYATVENESGTNEMNVAMAEHLTKQMTQRIDELIEFVRIK
tara:strand:- start:706 stop:933 length:228 start_codon:yes stop_codon:yes gene_type:complete